MCAEISPDIGQYQTDVETTPGYFETGIVLYSDAHPPVKYDDVMKWKRFPQFYAFVRETHCHRPIPLAKGQ